MNENERREHYGHLPLNEMNGVEESEGVVEEGHSPKFLSSELDKESGYYYMNARHYDGAIARFVTAACVIDGEMDTQGT